MDLKTHPMGADSQEFHVVSKLNPQTSIFNQKEEQELGGEGIACLGRDSSGLHYLFLQGRHERAMNRVWINLGFEFNMNNQLRVEKFFWAERSGLKNGNNDFQLGLDIVEKKRVVDFYFFDNHGLLVEANDLFNKKKGTNVELTQSHRAVRDLVVARRENKAFVAFDDGSVGIWEARNMRMLEKSLEKRDETRRERHGEAEHVSDAGLVLMDKAVVDEFNVMKQRFKKDIEDQKLKMEMRLLEEEDRAAKKMQRIESDLKAELEYKDSVIAKIREEKLQIENEITGILKKMESQHLSATEELEKIYDMKLENEEKKQLGLEKKLYLEKLSAQKEIQKIFQDNLKEIREIRRQSEGFILKSQKKESELNSNFETFKKNFQKNYEIREAEHEEQMLKKKNEFKRELLKQEGKISNLKIQNDRLKKNAIQVKKQIEEAGQDKLRVQKDSDSLKERLEEVRERESQARSEVARLRVAVTTKELALEKMKQRVTELEKLKNVLCFKNDELSRALKPKREQIEDLRSKIRRGERECDSFVEKIRKRENLLGFETSKLKEKERQIKEKEVKIKRLEKLVHGMGQVLGAAVRRSDQRECQRSVRDLYQMVKAYREEGHLQAKFKKNYMKSGKMIQKEMCRQVRRLENDLISRENSHVKSEIRNQKHLFKKIEENKTLINEINGLKNDNKNLNLKIRDLESKIRSMQTSKHEVRSKLIFRRSAQKKPRKPRMRSQTETKDSRESPLMVRNSGAQVGKGRERLSRSTPF